MKHYITGSLALTLFLTGTVFAGDNTNKKTSIKKAPRLPPVFCMNLSHKKGFMKVGRLVKTNKGAKQGAKIIMHIVKGRCMNHTPKKKYPKLISS